MGASLATCDTCLGLFSSAFHCVLHFWFPRSELEKRTSSVQVGQSFERAAFAGFISGEEEENVTCSYGGSKITPSLRKVCTSISLPRKKKEEEKSS